MNINDISWYEFDTGMWSSVSDSDYGAQIEQETHEDGSIWYTAWFMYGDTGAWVPSPMDDIACADLDGLKLAAALYIVKQDAKQKVIEAGDEVDRAYIGAVEYFLSLFSEDSPDHMDDVDLWEGLESYPLYGPQHQFKPGAFGVTPFDSTQSNYLYALATALCLVQRGHVTDTEPVLLWIEKLEEYKNDRFGKC